jgi:RNA polymerase-binding transcription factor DksA
MKHDPIDPAQSSGPEPLPHEPVYASSRPRVAVAPLLAAEFQSRLDALERRARLAFAREEEKLATELQEIWAARTRLARGDFGTCERCDASIAFSRLMASATARYCADCQANIEQL